MLKIKIWIRGKTVRLKLHQNLHLLKATKELIMSRLNTVFLEQNKIMVRIKLYPI